jgi:polyphosphate kinase 2 (PPK2 family)
LIDRSALLVKPGTNVVLSDFDPGSTGGFKKKSSAREKLSADLKRLSALQDIFYADGRYALLIVFQGMDCDDYLWRSEKVLPRRGRIGIANRSYYEEVCVARVHSAVLEREALPSEDVTARVWNERFEDINGFERHLLRNGTKIVKFFLNVSREEQRKRLLARIDHPDKRWKLSASDMAERPFWDRYLPEEPWYVIPADRKWFTRAAVIVATLDSMRLAYPTPDEARAAQLARYREAPTGAPAS